MPFKISDAYYFSWVVDEDERGTTVEIVLTNWDQNLVFDSIIFRKLARPVQIVENDRAQKVITATFPSGNSRIPLNSKYVDKPDQLKYTFNNRRAVMYLKEIVRKDMVYY